MRVSKRYARSGPKPAERWNSDLGWSVEAEDDIRIRPVQKRQSCIFVFTLAHAISVRAQQAKRAAMTRAA